MRRLTWLVGPPGAGKTTFAGAQRPAGGRVVEFTDMLGPLIEPAGISRGLLAGNGALVALVRSIELHPDNLALAPLLVVVGVAPEEALFAPMPINALRRVERLTAKVRPVRPEPSVLD